MQLGGRAIIILGLVLIVALFAAMQNDTNDNTVEVIEYDETVRNNPTPAIGNQVDRFDAQQEGGTFDDAAPYWEEPSYDPAPVEQRPAGVHPNAMKGKITRIVDGDTLHFDAVAYRLSLIDTPERGEVGALEATKALKALCPKGSTAYMDEDSITPFDKYGRHLGTVWCEGNNYATTAGAWQTWWLPRSIWHAGNTA